MPSILSTAEDLNNSEEQTFYKVLNVGGSKAGKTTLFKTFPGDKLAIGLTPRTRAALRGSDDIKLIEIFETESITQIVRKSAEYSIVPKAWDRLWNLIADLWEEAHKSEPFPFTSIMLDDLTTAVDYSMNHVLSLRKKDGTPVPKGLAGAAAEAHYMPQMTLLSRLLRHLFLTLPCHIYITGHISFHENKDTGVAMYYPKCYGNIRESIGSWFDEVYESTCEHDRTTKKIHYLLRTVSYGNKQFIGSTINKNGLWTSPFEVDLTQNPAGFSKILQLSQRR